MKQRHPYIFFQRLNLLNYGRGSDKHFCCRFIEATTIRYFYENI